MLVTIQPVVRAVRVASAPDDAFRTFVERLGEWWPLETHSVAADRASGEGSVGAVFEPRLGGRVYERMADGGEGHWATVTAWDPPSRLGLAWQPNPARPAATDVVVRFVPDAEGTIVVLEHGGWERLGRDGRDQRDSYDTGWIPVLDRFVRLAEA